jgi:hypothetical protein
MILPDFFASLFKNYGFHKIDTQNQKRLIIKTALAQGTWEQILWLFEFYGCNTVRDVFLEDYYGLRELPEPVVCLWGLLFLDKRKYREEIANMETDGSQPEKWRCRRLVPCVEYFSDDFLPERNQPDIQEREDL